MKTLQTDALAVLGNGPSLKSVNLHELSDLQTLGMNAAYRYWDMIDWRPSHYACLDDALIETHAAEIRRLIDESRIQSFFLTGRMLQLQPDLSGHPKLRFLDEFVPHWHATRGRELGLDLIDARPFKSTRSELLTTGSYATRYGAWLNHRTILLLGFDLTYATIPEAQSTGDLRLEMTETPRTNPNYFFDNYQMEGDVFHVPNPPSHTGDLHFDSFVALADDFDRNGVAARLINTQERSRLIDIEAIATHSFDAVADEPALGNLVIPYTAAEVERIRNNFWLWSQASFRPRNRVGPISHPALLFVANDGEAYAKADEIRADFERYPSLIETFSTLDFVNLELSGAENVYERDNRHKGFPHGLRAGPNNVFFGAIAETRSRLGNSLYMETDCIPVKPGWLDAAANILDSDRTSWVLGSIYLGDDALGDAEKRHLNGNAIYATSNPEFQAFIRTEWEPELRNSIRKRPELPFDCLIEHLMNESNSTDTRPHSDWSRIRSRYHRFRHFPFILNFAGDAPCGKDLVDRLQVHIREWPEVYIVHSNIAARAVSKLKANSTDPSNAVSLDDLFSAISSNRSQGAQTELERRALDANFNGNLIRQIRERLHKLFG